MTRGVLVFPQVTTKAYVALEFTTRVSTTLALHSQTWMSDGRSSSHKFVFRDTCLLQGSFPPLTDLRKRDRAGIVHPIRPSRWSQLQIGADLATETGTKHDGTVTKRWA